MTERSRLVKLLPCIACEIERVSQLQPTEAHHLNIGGKAGQKRMGDIYQIPLCTWHHRGDPPQGVTAGEMAYSHGPSMARDSKMFRFTYGLDERLWELTNAKVQQIT